MRPATVMAMDGEPLDAVIWRGARLGPEALPAVFSANPGICEKQVFAAGDIIKLPAALSVAPAPRTQRKQLWD